LTGRKGKVTKDTEREGPRKMAVPLSARMIKREQRASEGLSKSGGELRPSPSPMGKRHGSIPK